MAVSSGSGAANTCQGRNKPRRHTLGCRETKAGRRGRLRAKRRPFFWTERGQTLCSVQEVAAERDAPLERCSRAGWAMMYVRATAQPRDGYAFHMQPVSGVGGTLRGRYVLYQYTYSVPVSYTCTTSVSQLLYEAHICTTYVHSWRELEYLEDSRGFPTSPFRSPPTPCI